jgi:hypothetical protein
MLYSISDRKMNEYGAEKSHPSAILSTTNLTHTAMQLAAGVHGASPVANSLGQAIAQITVNTKYSQTFLQCFRKNSTNLAHYM